MSSTIRFLPPDPKSSSGSSPRARGGFGLSVALLLALSFVPRASAQDDDLELVVDDSDSAPAPSPTPAPTPDDVRALLEEVRTLRARVEALESEAAPVVEAEPAIDEDAAIDDEAVTETEDEPDDFLSDFFHGLTLSAYIQAQYEWSDLSEDQLGQGGGTLNRDRFVIRRGRLRLTGRWDFVEIDLEIDASTTRGSFVGPRRATVGGVLQGESPDVPLARLRAGLTEIPFGHEVRLGQREMPFMERTTGSLAFFRGPIDVGARLDGGIGPFRYDLAVMGGTPIDDRAGAASVDPTSAPDVIGRLGVDIAATSDFTIGAGVSFLWGAGFHAGTDATQNRVEWRDLNESGTLDTGELVGVPGRAATPSATFEHWALGADLELALHTAAGATQLFGEIALATNLDRSLFVADPIVGGADIRELTGYVALVQDVLEWGVVGFRYDYYDPASDLVEARRGIAVPNDQSIHTLSPMIGVRLPSGLVPGVGGRIVFQYDVILDSLGRNASGVPVDLRNDQLTLRVQGEM